jgi:hypothetical protein
MNRAKLLKEIEDKINELNLEKHALLQEIRKETLFDKEILIPILNKVGHINSGYRHENNLNNIDCPKCIAHGLSNGYKYSYGQMEISLVGELKISYDNKVEFTKDINLNFKV